VPYFFLYAERDEKDSFAARELIARYTSRASSLLSQFVHFF
jgi:hypothetical protein